MCPNAVSADLPLPRFAGLKNEPEMRYAAAPPASDPQGAPLGSVAWNAADRSSFKHLEANADKKPVSKYKTRTANDGDFFLPNTDIFTINNIDCC